MRKVNASTILELVITLTIISICFAVATQVFTQSNRSTIQFREVKDQTEFQSMILDALIHDTLPDVQHWKNDWSTIEVLTTQKDSLIFSDFSLVNHQKTIWQQTFFSER